MENLNNIPGILQHIPLSGILRIDVGLEGNWSSTVVTVWFRDSGNIDFSKVIRSHPSHKPSLELYFQGAWLGIHCYSCKKGKNVFNEHFARKVIDYVEENLR